LYDQSPPPILVQARKVLEELKALPATGDNAGLGMKPQVVNGLTRLETQFVNGRKQHIYDDFCS
jgi:hypothetical protein